jgi:hypothetical protein
MFMSFLRSTVKNHTDIAITKPFDAKIKGFFWENRVTGFEPTIHAKDNSFSIIDKFVIENQNDCQTIVRH